MKKTSRFPEFAERLRELVGEGSQTDFAEKVGVSRQTINYYVHGSRIPDILFLKTICQKTGVSADWLLGLSDVTKAPRIQLKDIAEYLGIKEKQVQLLREIIACGKKKL